MSAAWRSLRLLALGKALAVHGVDGGFRLAGRDAFSGTVSFTIVDKAPARPRIAHRVYDNAQTIKATRRIVREWAPTEKIIGPQRKSPREM